jgi:hypothetical protein
VGGGVPTAGSVKPVLAMTCNACGHTVFMSPLKAGIISLAQAPPTQDAQPETVEVETEEEL